MQSLKQQLQAYGDYHQQPITKYTHFVGVPIVVLSLLILLGWVHISSPNLISISFAWLVTIAAIVYYVMLDWQLGLCVAAGLVILNLIAMLFTHDGFSRVGFYAFLATTIVGWGLQFIGHYFEGKKPALLDNLCHALIAPMFVAAEIAFMFGLRKDLQS